MPQLGDTLATVLGLLLLLGACGKSAQVPLQSWLLDAMEGPTPVSALIHAATMVTAGVYLVTRSHAVYAETPAASTAVVVVGVVTLLAGAWIGCAKDDIKKALAGSTMSQIGYMMLAAGIGPAGYAFAIFHLITHGFFKANLFLGAGSVMHAMDDDVDMRHYGGAAHRAADHLRHLRRRLPGDHRLPVPVRLLLQGPHHRGRLRAERAGRAAGHAGRRHHRVLHDAGDADDLLRGEALAHRACTRTSHRLVMTVPLIVLGAGSVVGGLVLNNWISGWLDPAVGGEHTGEEATACCTSAWSGSATLVVVAIGVAIAVFVFGRGRQIPVHQPASRSPFTLAGRNDLYGDALNEAVFMRPGQQLTDGLMRLEDQGIDGAVDGTATVISGVSSRARRIQNGFVRSYALPWWSGAGLVGVILILGRLG